MARKTFPARASYLVMRAALEDAAERYTVACEQGGDGVLEAGALLRQAAKDATRARRASRLETMKAATADVKKEP